MKPNLTQSRRGAEKERRGHGRLDRERYSTVIAAKPHDSMVGLARRCRPKPQPRSRRLQRQERKRNSPLHLGSLNIPPLFVPAKKSSNLNPPVPLETDCRLARGHNREDARFTAPPSLAGLPLKPKRKTPRKKA
jgi:hypothetical protein